MRRLLLLVFSAAIIVCFPGFAKAAMVTQAPPRNVKVRPFVVPAVVARFGRYTSLEPGTNYSGTVTSIPGSFEAFAAAYDTLDQNYYLLGGEIFYQLTPGGVETQIANFFSYGFPAQLVWDDHTGVFYVSIPQAYVILAITPTGTISLLAGGTRGTADGTGANAQFQNPTGMTLDPTNHLLWVVDNDRLRTVSEAGVVATVGPTGQFVPEFGQSGNLSDAIDLRTGDVAIADGGQDVVHLFHPATATYSTLAGRCVVQQFGCAVLHIDGPGSQAVFGAPSGISYDAASNAYYMADNANYEVRKIDIHGNVSTLAGSGFPASVDGTGLAASFGGPECGGLNPVAHTLLVCDGMTGAFRIVTLTGKKAPRPTNAISMLETATIDSNPSGIAATADGNIWYAEQSASYIARMLPDGRQREFVLPARFGLPYDVAADSLGDLWFGNWTGITQFNQGSPYLARMTPTGQIREQAFSEPCQYGQQQNTFSYLLTPDATADMWFGVTCRNILGFSTKRLKLTQYATVGFSGLAIGADSSIWVGTTSEILEYARDGSVIATFTNVDADAGIAWGSDGHVWFLSNFYGTIGSLDPATGLTVVYTLPSCGCNRGLGNLIAGSDGALWFTEGYSFGSETYAGGVGRVTTTGVYSEYQTYEPRSQPNAITSDPSGHVWLTDIGAEKIGHYP